MKPMEGILSPPSPPLSPDAFLNMIRMWEYLYSARVQCGGNRRVSYVKLGEKEGEGWDQCRRRLHTSTAHLSQVPVDLPELSQFSLYRYYIFINFANILTRLCSESYRIEMDISYRYGSGTERYGVRAV